MVIKKIHIFCLAFFLSTQIESSSIEKVTYSAWDSADVDLLYVLPSKINSDTKVLFIIHGNSRDANKYLSLWMKDAKNLDAWKSRVEGSLELKPGTYKIAILSGTQANNRIIN